jgi:membrane associated rhomboid family serine protease
MRRIRLHYNAPVVLTFSLLCAAVLVLDHWFGGVLIPRLFVTTPPFAILDPLDFLRLATHVLGHASPRHLFGNLTMILLLGPILEERYGSADMIKMMLLTALVVGLLNTLVSSSGLLGASSIVFMFITLVSIVDLRQGTIPVSFILVAVVFVGSEIVGAFGPDDVSQAGHIAGAVLGALFGFALSNGRDANWFVRAVNWVLDWFWVLMGVLAIVAVLPALVYGLVLWAF